MVEEWKPVVGWEDVYEVSHIGRVKSVHRVIVRSDGTKQSFKQKILSRRTNLAGYLIVTLSDLSNNKRRTARVHRLVAEAFIENPLNLPEVNHIDSDRSNAHIDNLEWVTASQNRYHGYHYGYVNLPHRKGEGNNSSKLKDEDVVVIRDLSKQGFSSRNIAKMFSVDKRTILRVINKETWSHVPAGRATLAQGGGCGCF